MQTLKVNCLILPISYQHLRSMQCVCIWQPSQRNGRQQQCLSPLLQLILFIWQSGHAIPFILSILFAFVYYFMREQTERENGLGLKRSLAIFVGSPILMLAMGVLNYVTG